MGFDPAWARFADGILTSLGHQPSDGVNDGARTRGLRHGKPALYLLSYVRMVPGRGLEPRFSASKAALLPLETSPERSWLGEKGSNLRFHVQSVGPYLLGHPPANCGACDGDRTRLLPLDRRASTASGPHRRAVYVHPYSVDKVLGQSEGPGFCQALRERGAELRSPLYPLLNSTVPRAWVPSRCHGAMGSPFWAKHGC